MSRRSNVVLLTIAAHTVLAGTKIGDSIAVNGCCLTVVAFEKNSLSFEVMAETARTSTLGRLRLTEQVNLERSLKAGDRVSGHFVLGHVDCLGIVRRRGVVRQNLEFEIAFPREFFRYCIPRGSVCIDGISLTIADTRPGLLKVSIIPHTLQNTTLAHKSPSQAVNLEFDVLAKNASASLR